MAGYKFPDETEIDTTDVDVKATKAKEKPEEDFEVEVIDDTPVKDKGRAALAEPVDDPTDEELSTYSEGVQNRIKKLTHARHDERRAKEATLREKAELERMAGSLLEENRKLKGYVNQGEKYFAESSQKNAELELEKARTALRAAHEAFDTDGIIVAQEALADAKLLSSEAKKFRPTPLQDDAFDVQTQQVANTAPTPDEKTLRWQAKNQWFGSDGFEEVTSYALGLHQKLVKGGVDPSSSEYFEQIDARVKSKFPEVFGEEDRVKAADAPKRRTSVVAPVARSTGVRKVQLTSTQVALAKKFGLSPQQYAAQVALLENDNV